ncbi:MAG: DUF2255 family protein [Gordonia sp. (in: high G+C Gram-positive bacteria)]|uniref:DUF2255 family protein n=1 Tax=Gordonia sp. (in: high G+C Gram-positive bacteria) TaxID=84139 RepID=UPI0039E4D3FD
MTAAWSAAELAEFSSQDELFIETRRKDGSTVSAVPIWMVVVDEKLYVRTWEVRTTGWYGRAVRDGTAAVSTGGPKTPVTVEQVGSLDSDAIEAAYRRKYRRYAASTLDPILTDDGIATTLRLTPTR